MAGAAHTGGVGTLTDRPGNGRVRAGSAGEVDADEGLALAKGLSLGNSSRSLRVVLQNEGDERLGDVDERLEGICRNILNQVRYSFMCKGLSSLTELRNLSQLTGHIDDS